MDVTPASHAAALLADHLSDRGRPVVVDGATVQVGERHITVGAHVEDAVRQDGSLLMAVGFEVVLDGIAMPAMRTGAVGIAPTPDAALRQAAEDWAAQYGIALAEALAPQDSVAPTRRWGAYRAYRGPIGIRGAPPAPDAVTALVAHVDTALAQLFAPAVTPADRTVWRGLTIAMARADSGQRSVFCQIDGNPAPALDRIARAAPWPDDGAFLVKTFYLLVAEPDV